MSIVNAQHISKAYQGRAVFDDLTFSVDRGDRIGLVGENGTGKTTLMGMIQGWIEPDEGTIAKPSSLVVSYLEQRPLAMDIGTSDVLENTRFTEMERRMAELERVMSSQSGDVLDQAAAEYSRIQREYEASGAFDYRARLAKTLAGLGLDNAKMAQSYETLSGGEKMRVALGRFLLEKSDFMLLDEPTNHLDLDGLEWLQNYLSSSHAAMMIVSHDRWFLDHVCNVIFELEGGRLYIYRGNYTESREQKRAIHENLDRTMSRLATEIKRQEGVTQTMLSHRKMNAYHSREKVVQKLKSEMEALKGKKNAKRRMNFSVVASTEKKDMNRVLMEAEHLSLSFDRPIFQDVSFMLHAKEKIALLGPNGCGKTSLLRVLLGEQAPDEGRVRFIGDPGIAFMGQMTRFDDETLTVYEWLSRKFPRTETAVRTRLAQFGFREESLIKRLESLSGGERHRLSLCSLLEEAPELIILDEPTNHLDIESRRLLEEALLSFPGAVVVVSHDRAFIQAAASRVLGFVGTSVLPFDSYEAWRDAASETKTLPGEALVTELPPHLEEQGNEPEVQTHFPKQDCSADPRSFPSEQIRLMTSPSAGLPTSDLTDANDLPVESDRLSGGRPASSDPVSRTEARRIRAEYRRRVSDFEKAIARHEEARTAFETADPSAHTPEAYEEYAVLLSELDTLYKDYFAYVESHEALEQA